jgi:hypothetical protein
MAERSKRLQFLLFKNNFLFIFWGWMHNWAWFLNLLGYYVSIACGM